MRTTRQRARDALGSDDFRRLFAIRLLSQSGDGLFQAVLISSIVFDPERQDTIMSFAVATLLHSPGAWTGAHDADLVCVAGASPAGDGPRGCAVRLPAARVPEGHARTAGRWRRCAASEMLRRLTEQDLRLVPGRLHT